METFAALCGIGLERVVSNELKKLNLTIIDSRPGKVRFQADIRGCYLALLSLRTVDRVLWETARFSAANFDDLFDGIREIPWERYIPQGMGLHVEKIRINKNRTGALRGVTTIQAMVHKAIAERLCAKYAILRLPEDPVAEVRVHIEGDQVEVLLDCSGEPLFKRGYRTAGGIAPLRETSAAALLFLANWRRKYPLYDPFCGAGTIVIEAAMYAWDMAPGLSRSFALSALAQADKAAEAEIRRDLWERVDFTRTIRIYGSDDDPRMIALARANLSRAYKQGRGSPADPAGLPSLEILPMQKLRPKEKEEGVIITNPPYGNRIGTVDSAERIYREMDGLATAFSGWKLGVVTDHPGFESHFGKKADSCREFINGAVQAYFYQFEKL